MPAPTTQIERLPTASEVAEILCVKRQSLYSRSFRFELGLPAIKLGKRKIGFAASDVARVIARRREHLPRNGQEDR
ncbi:MAG: hypothetical protein HY347_04340 [candidate division NC10 bacterium]|nr:hypothetical protein [candidate division NC10 bacterium]